MYKLILIISLPLSSFSLDYSFQQIWISGPGVPGPEYNWGEAFDQSSNLAWWALDPVYNWFYQLELEHYYITLVDETFSGAVSVTSADIDGDSDFDLVASSGYNNQIKWWENLAGNGQQWTAHTVASDFNGAFSVKAGDINGDGFIDIISSSRSDNQLAWWDNTDGSGTVWAQNVISDDFNDAEIILVIDLDGDNDFDIVASSATEYDVLWFENLDSMGTSWSEHNVAETGMPVKCIETADVDGDGDSDILAAYGQWNLVWWENTAGSGTQWVEHIISNTDYLINDITAADVNGDGDIDLVGVKETGYSRVCYWDNADGSGLNWTRIQIENYYWGASDVVTFDPDNDGDQDILASAHTTRFVKFWENMNGAGTEWERRCVQGDFSGLTDLCSVDLDGNSISDVVAVSNEGTLAWWKDSTYKETGWLESTIDINSGDICYYQLTASTNIPSGTSIDIQLRASDDPNDMGDWSEPLPFSSYLQDIFAGTQYIQYRITLSTENPLVTPSLSDIFVYYNTITGVAETENTELHLIGSCANPSPSMMSASFYTPDAIQADFALYDLAGRISERIPSKEYGPGLHTVDMQTVPPGTYLLLMTAGEFTDFCRVIVLE